jgi:hypothetical protein
MELKRGPEESCERLKAKQSNIANKLKEPCQSGAFLVSSQLKVSRRVGKERRNWCCYSFRTNWDQS